MNKSILDDLLVVLKENLPTENENDMRSLEKASEEFEKLVEQGLAKRRGYNLRTIQDTHLLKGYINK